MKKVLYIDQPFQNEKGGDKNRSKFIWNAIKDNFEVDLLLLKTYQDPNYKYKKHTGYVQLYELTTSHPASVTPKAIFQFSAEEISKFEDILKANNYDRILIRFAAPYLLAEAAQKICPQTSIIIDIDMLMSRLTKLSWDQNPKLNNRYFLLEHLKFRKFEKELFNKPYLFLFTNYLEMKMAIKDNVKKNSPSRFEVLPNVMQANDHPVPKEKENYILFFGSLNSAANSDAFIFLAKEIYPLIVNKLEQTKTKIKIVGRNQTPIYKKLAAERDYISIIGEVDDINKEIASSLFTILPIRIASGTRTRILEAANLRTAVVSTSIGAEGFEFEEDEIIIRDNVTELAEEIIKLLDKPELAKEMGIKIFQKSNKKYLDTSVADNLIEQIENL